jgi:ferredoxin
MHLEIQEHKCSGCKLCQQICAIEHFQEINPKKSAIKIRAEFPVPGIFRPETCTQCGECAEVCPADAIEERDGAYVIDPELCTGCGECVEECPTDAIFFPSTVSHPIKCDLCLKCTEVCNTGALTAVRAVSRGKDYTKCTDSVERPYA